MKKKTYLRALIYKQHKYYQDGSSGEDQSTNGYFHNRTHCYCFIIIYH